MADVKVTCITMVDLQNSHEHITHIGNTIAGWKWTRQQVIVSIELKINTFYVLDPLTGQRSDIGVVRQTGKDPYLRTVVDGNWNDNLLSLDQCP